MDSIVLDHRYKEQIVKFLGYKDKKPNAKILRNLEEEISKLSLFVKPKFYSKRYEILAFEKRKVILEDDKFLSGEYIAEKLKDCKSIYVNVATIGGSIDCKIKKYIEDKEIMKSLILDKIGVVALDKLVDINRSFFNEKLKINDLNITCEIYPGDSEWNIENQKTIFNLLKEENMEVTLNQFFIMNPIKSVAFIWGVGKGEGYSCKNRCSICKNKCRFREYKDIKAIIN